MTLFEYITVAISLVLALSVARTVDGLRSSLASGRRYWIHAAWVVVKLTNPMTFWWGIWRFRDSPAWDFPAFMLVLAWPVVLYLQVSSLVTRQPELVSDWRSHFYQQRKWFFGANLCLNLTTVVLSLALGGNLTGDPLVWLPRLAVLGLSAAGFATANERAHGFIVISIIITVVVGYWGQSIAPHPALSS